MQISENGLRLIERFEGFVSHPYWDPYGRVWTRGYGETEGITADSPSISQGEAQRRLARLVDERYAPAVREIAGLNQNQFDALCSFVWNVGPGAISAGTALGGLLRRGHWTYAAAALLAYVRAGGQVLQGLVTRRQAERVLFLEPVVRPNRLGVLTRGERDEVEAYDRLRHHPHLHLHHLAQLREALVAERKDIWRAAEHGILSNGQPTAPGWGFEQRKARYEILLSRTR
jgi:lysozyme